VHRSPGSGSLWLGNQGFIDDPIINTGSTQTKGIDTEINYTWDMAQCRAAGIPVDRNVCQ